MVEKVVKTVIIVIFISFTFFLTFGHVYTVKDTGNANAQTTHQIVSFAELTVSDVINKASISLREEDVVTPTLDAALDSGEINIVRSRPISVQLTKKLQLITRQSWLYQTSLRVLVLNSAIKTI